MGTAGQNSNQNQTNKPRRPHSRGREFLPAQRLDPGLLQSEPRRSGGALRPSATPSPFAKAAEPLRPPLAEAATAIRGKARGQVTALSREPPPRPHPLGNRCASQAAEREGAAAGLFSGRRVWGSGSPAPPASHLGALRGAASPLGCQVPLPVAQVHLRCARSSSAPEGRSLKVT